MHHLSGVPVKGGFLFDRLQEAIEWATEERHAIATCCIRNRAPQARKAPRILVVCGPPAVGRGPLLKKVVQVRSLWVISMHAAFAARFQQFATMRGSLQPLVYETRPVPFTTSLPALGEAPTGLNHL